LNIITSYKTYKLRFDLEDFDGNKRFAVYSSFAIWPEIFHYKTRLGSYSEGDAGTVFMVKYFCNHFGQSAIQHNRSALHCL